RESRQPIVLSIRPPVLDRHVPSFDIALSIQPPAKRRQNVGIGFGIPGAEPADHRHRRLLRPRRERPSNRSVAEKHEEFASPEAEHRTTPTRQGWSSELAWVLDPKDSTLRWPGHPVAVRNLGTPIEGFRSAAGHSRRINGLLETSAVPPMAPGKRTWRKESYGP